MIRVPPRARLDRAARDTDFAVTRARRTCGFDRLAEQAQQVSNSG